MRVTVDPQIVVVFDVSFQKVSYLIFFFFLVGGNHFPWIHFHEKELGWERTKEQVSRVGLCCVVTIVWKWKKPISSPADHGTLVRETKGKNYNKFWVFTHTHKCTLHSPISLACAPLSSLILHPPSPPQSHSPSLLNFQGGPLPHC